jgi:GAF domain-containing protein
LGRRGTANLRIAHNKEEVAAVAAESGPAEELSGVFARMSGLLLTEQTVSTALKTITSLAADTIAGSAGSGVSLLDAGGERTTSAATDPVVEELDTLQYQLDEGPCLSAWREQATMRSGPLETEQRWPSWSRRAYELGMRSVLSAPLINGERAMGAIKVYSRLAEAYSDRDEDLLRRFATQAAIFVSNVQAVQAAEHLSDSLKETLRFRDLLATARGVVIARRGVGVEDANRHLITESYRSRRLIRDVAQRIVASPQDV